MAVSNGGVDGGMDEVVEEDVGMWKDGGLGGAGEEGGDAQMLADVMNR